MAVDVEILEKLSNADGIVAGEQPVRDIIKEEIEEYVDEITYDGLGSIICKQKGTGKGPSIMISAHMDEVGFMVRSITDGGLIMLMVVGGVKTSTLAYQKLRITTESGKKISGVVAGDYQKDAGSKMYLDIGATTKEEVVNLGVNIGDIVTYSTEFEKFDLGDVYAGKAMDDRYGCFTMIEIAKRMSKLEHDNDIYYVGAYGEEVGLRGAQTASYLINPDLGFVIDVATYPDQFIRDNTNNRQMGLGPMLTHFDRTLAPNRKMMNFVTQTAKNNNLPLQHDMFNSGGTDGGEIHKTHEGKATVVTCLPCRYGHCAYSIVDVNDADNLAALYVKMLTQINDDFKQEVYKF